MLGLDLTPLRRVERFGVLLHLGQRGSWVPVPELEPSQFIGATLGGPGAIELAIVS